MIRRRSTARHGPRRYRRLVRPSDSSHPSYMTDPVTLYHADRVGTGAAQCHAVAARADAAIGAAELAHSAGSDQRLFAAVIVDRDDLGRAHVTNGADIVSARCHRRAAIEDVDILLVREAFVLEHPHRGAARG